MPQVNADRNLLFGIIALQMDFITKDQLVGAMQDWVLDKSKSLGEIFLKKGILATDTHSLLEALVKKHLAQHNNDPEKSLAAVGAGPSIKEHLRDLTDPDVQASLVRVPARPEAHDPYATRAPSIGEATSTGLRFRILRPYARGGLGEVLVARDEELAREVALKQIQDSHADDRESQIRFKLEAEITGGLEHPGIVPVYGLGQYADGRPYYAMRFIRGHSLKEASERFHKADGPNRDPAERSLSLRALLGRFVDVCNAIAYAHSRGVLHRDLKPGNIMLGKYGETLVVDWGLAKTLGGPPPSENTEPGEGTLTPSSASLGSQTIMGAAMGTPQFMSPEQASGRLDQLGPASDVYSLGATLYSLLTGQAPFKETEVGTVLTKVQRGEFPPPHQVKADVPKPLEAICLKAMALKPSERYPSPRDLADDIEHWLADERVSAYEEPWTVTARRWVSRHMPLVVGTVTAVLVAAVGLGIATVLLTAANERERKAKELAEHNFQLAKKAVDDYYTVVSQDVLLREPNMEDLRKRLLTDARKYYGTFVAEHVNDAGLKGELGKATYRLAQITADIDNETKAIALHEQAREIFIGLTKAEPQNPDWQSELAKCWYNLGRLKKNADQLAAAEQDYKQALQIWQPLSAGHPTENLYRAELARSQLGLGNVYQKTRQWDEARTLYETALQTRAALAKEEPKNYEYQRDFALTASNLARVYAILGQKDKKADPAFAQAIKAQEALVAEFPQISQYANDLARSYFNLADLYGPSQDGIKLFDKAAAIWTELVNKHYAVTDFRVNLAEAYLAQALAYATIGQPEKAAHAAKDSLELKKRLVRDHTGVTTYQEDLARGYFQLGRVYRAAGDVKKAKSAFEEASGVLEALAHSGPLVPQAQSDLARTYHNLGLVFDEQKDKTHAEEVYRKAMVIWDKLVSAHPDDPDFAREAYATAYNLGKLFQDSGNAQLALDWYGKAVRPVEALSVNQPNDRALRASLVKVYWKRAEVLTKQGRQAEALQDWDRALGLAEPDRKPWFQLQHTIALARAGDHAQAAAAAGEIGLKAKAPEIFYQLAGIYALSMRSATADVKLAADARQGITDQYAARAMQLLESARAGGFFKAQANVYRLKSDVELDALRSRPEYRKLVSDLEQKSKAAS